MKIVSKKSKKRTLESNKIVSTLNENRLEDLVNKSEDLNFN